MLILIRGLPGSGKSTYARSLRCFAVEADMWNRRDGRCDYDHSRMGAAHAWCLAKAMEAMDAGFDVAVSNVFSHCKFMLPYVSYAKEKGVPVRIVECCGKHQSHLSMPWKARHVLKKTWEPLPDEWTREVEVVVVEDGNDEWRPGSQEAAMG